ncbi:hypothetical protein NVS89_22745 [Ancylobacter sp. MQZ15Z-1]|uniref:Uncharacterized protein n=1 Tax=Ancylobacter mangrovi TaxID=2972472 RepID=A0A9X2PI81_9HYPH|nr:hypothetical protein [Ancylobacter mangrovi]MCS0497914.1 hypothetical protein [Ancylobacter mangrovi]
MPAATPAPLPRGDLRGDGWLRTRTMGSSTASYAIEPGAGPVLAGVLRAETFTMLAARGTSPAFLVLESGRPVPIRIGELDRDCLHFDVARALLEGGDGRADGFG